MLIKSSTSVPHCSKLWFREHRFSRTRSVDLIPKENSEPTIHMCFLFFEFCIL